MKNASRKPRYVAIFVVICMMIALFTIPASATDKSDANDVEEILLVVNDEGELEFISSTNDGYHTFADVSYDGWTTGIKTYNFTLEKPCELRIAFAGAYLNSPSQDSDRVMYVELQGPFASEYESMPMNVRNSVLVFNGNLSNNRLSAGKYKLQLMPDSQTDRYTITGSVYSLNY